MSQLSSVRRAKVNEVRNWVEALGVLTCDNMTPTEAEMKVLAYVPMLQADFGPEAFTQDSLSHVARACKFFPAYSEVYTHLREWWRERHPPLQQIAAPPPPEPRPPPTEAEIAYVHERVQEMVAAMTAKPLFHEPGDNTLEQEPARPRASHLSREQLARAYQAAGVSGPKCST